MLNVVSVLLFLLTIASVYSVYVLIKHSALTEKDKWYELVKISGNHYVRYGNPDKWVWFQHTCVESWLSDNDKYGEFNAGIPLEKYCVDKFTNTINLLNSGKNVLDQEIEVIVTKPENQPLELNELNDVIHAKVIGMTEEERDEFWDKMIEYHKIKS